MLRRALALGACVVAVGCSKKADPVVQTVPSSAPVPTSPAAQAVTSWLAAKTPEGRAALIYRPDINRPDFLARDGHTGSIGGQVSMDGCGKRPMDGACQMLLDDADVGFVWLRATPDGYRVDWRASYVVNPMAMAAFQASMPTEPVTWRIEAKLDTYFNYEFMGQQASYYSFRISELGERRKNIYAYGKKGAPDAEALFKRLGDGESHQVTVALAFPASRRSNEITKLIAYYGDDFVQTAREIADLPESRKRGVQVAPSATTGAAPTQAPQEPVRVVKAAPAAPQPDTVPPADPPPAPARAPETAGTDMGSNPYRTAAAPADPNAPFDRGAAAQALGAVSLAGCGAEPRSGGHLQIVFSNDGSARASDVSAQGASADALKCIGDRFSAARVPPFSGSAVKVGKSFVTP